MGNVLLILLTIALTSFVGWVGYDAGYDQGWKDRDEGKPY